VHTKGKLTACGNDHELHSKKKGRKETERGRNEREERIADVSFPCFFRVSNLPLVNMFVKKRRGRGAAEEGFGEAEDHREGSGIRSSVTNDSSEKFALLLAPLPFQVFQSAKNSQTDIYLEGFTLRYTRTVAFSTSVIGGSFLWRDHRCRKRFPIIPGRSTSRFLTSPPPHRSRCLIKSFFKLKQRDKIRESSQFAIIGEM